MSVVDLNLIRPLCALLDERHMSNAAQRCGVSQPAMSRILKHLRAIFDDKLLVRSGREYERTPLGDVLLADAQDILNRADATLSGSRFTPSLCDTRFRIATTDYASVVYLPSLLRDIEQLAPNASLNISAWSERSYEDLGTGRLDAAIMSADDPPGTLLCEKLFTEDYVCMVALDHPVAGTRMSLETYLQYRHAVIDIMHGLQPSIDQPLAALGARRRVGYLTPFLGSAVFAVARTSLVLTAPRRLATSYRAVVPVRTLAAPREITRSAYSLLWHKRLDTSLAHAWFRERIRVVAKVASI